MTARRNIAILIGFVLSASLLSASVTAALLERYYGRAYMQTLGQICEGVIDRLADSLTDSAAYLPDNKQETNRPNISSQSNEHQSNEHHSNEQQSNEHHSNEHQNNSLHTSRQTALYQIEQAVLTALKEYRYDPSASTGQNLLLSYGYRPTDFLQSAGIGGRLFIWSGFAAGSLLFLVSFSLLHKRVTMQVNEITNYLEQVNRGSGGVLGQVGEGAFSRLQDELYKTVTALRQTKDTALAARNNFAENLYNIAHQLKTPITAISLSVQMLRSEMTGEGTEAGHLARIAGQLARLTRLEEALLLLSRIDAGTLTLEKKEVDVFTLLVLSAENLQELFREKNITVEIPEAGGTCILADMEWTMEAVMNLLKNCMEHTPSGGTVRCVYEKNPLYTLIRIQDTGPGFAKEDLPRLFERFYRGKNAAGGGIGIGLALSKAIIEGQNGILSAYNLQTDVQKGVRTGGACFEIRFYR